MYLQRDGNASGKGRFLLALSLSTLTALAVTAPLALQALSVEDQETAPAVEGPEVTHDTSEQTAKTVPPNTDSGIGGITEDDVIVESTETTKAPTTTVRQTTVSTTQSTTSSVAEDPVDTQPIDESSTSTSEKETESTVEDG